MKTTNDKQKNIMRTLITRCPSLLLVIALFASAMLMTSCSDDKTVKRYKVVNIDDFGDVPLYAGYSNLPEDNEIIGYVPSRTDCELISSGNYGNQHHTQMVFANGVTAYVADRYVFEKTFDGAAEQPDAFDKYYGHSKYVDKAIDRVRAWQDSDMHYSIDQMWLYGKLALWGVIFTICAVWALSQISSADKAKWWVVLLVAASGLMLMYYEWQNAIVMGGGYEPTYTDEYFNTQSLGWFLNLIVTIILAIIYCILALVVMLVVMLLQQLIVPAICITSTGLSQGTILGNAMIFASIYICTILGLIIGPDSYDTLIIIAAIISAIGIVIGVISGYRSRNYLAILLICAPLLYIISIATTYAVFKAMLYIFGLLASLLFVLGAAGTKSKFQSQDDDSITVVRNQAGQTVGHIDKEGWHDGEPPV